MPRTLAASVTKKQVAPVVRTPEYIAAAKVRMAKEFPLFFMEMNDIQDRFIRIKNRFGRTPRRRILEAGNKLGKTMIGVAEDIAWMVGYRPWLRTDDPDYKIDVKVPNISMVGCETYKHSVAEKIEPMFRLLVPSTCQPVFKPGPTGVLNVLKLPFGPKGEKCGSELHIRSYDEQASTFEGLDYTGIIHWDEPPPESIWRAAERGKVVSNAPSIFTMTPLKEAWIYDRLSSKAAVVN